MRGLKIYAVLFLALLYASCKTGGKGLVRNSKAGDSGGMTEKERLY